MSLLRTRLCQAILALCHAAANPFRDGKGLALLLRVATCDLWRRCRRWRTRSNPSRRYPRLRSERKPARALAGALRQNKGVKMDAETLIYGTAGSTVTSLRDGDNVVGPDGMKEGYLLGAGIEHTSSISRFRARSSTTHVATNDVRHSLAAPHRGLISATTSSRVV